MDLEIIAQNIKRLRTDSRLTQAALAESSGLSLPAIKKIEGGKVAPRVANLQSIAGVLGVRLQELFTPVQELKTVRFRSNKKMKNRESIISKIAKWLDGFSSLEEALEDVRPFRFADLVGADQELSNDDAVALAGRCRVMLGLKNTEPIHDIAGLLESAGVKLRLISLATAGFFGLSVGKEDKGPAVVVNVWEKIPTERCIFSAAHELGHLVLHPDAFNVEAIEENPEEEKQADLFASHFLLPHEGFKKEWNEAAGLPFVDRVFKIKRIFRVSYKTVLYRLVESGAADQKIWPKFYTAHLRRYGQSLAGHKEPMGLTDEPFRMDRHDFFEDRLSRLTRRAVEQEEISLSRGAEILDITVEDMKDLLMEWVVNFD